MQGASVVNFVSRQRTDLTGRNFDHSDSRSVKCRELDHKRLPSFVSVNHRADIPGRKAAFG